MSEKPRIESASTSNGPYGEKPKITAPFRPAPKKTQQFVIFDTDYIGSIEFMVNGKMYNAATVTEIDDTIQLLLVEQEKDDEQEPE